MKRFIMAITLLLFGGVACGMEERFDSSPPYILDPNGYSKVPCIVKNKTIFNDVTGQGWVMYQIETYCVGDRLYSVWLTTPKVYNACRIGDRFDKGTCFRKTAPKKPQIETKWAIDCGPASYSFHPQECDK